MPNDDVPTRMPDYRRTVQLPLGDFSAQPLNIATDNPYLKLTCPDLPVTERQRCAEVLTDAVVRLNASRFVPAADLRERYTVHFTPYNPDSMAVGGRLMQDRAEPDVTLEYSHRVKRRGFRNASHGSAAKSTRLLAR